MHFQKIIKQLNMPERSPFSMKRKWNLVIFWSCNFQMQQLREWEVYIDSKTISTETYAIFKDKILKSSMVFFFFFFFDHILSIWKFPGLGQNLTHSSNPGCCSDNTGSLNHCARWELWLLFLFSFFNFNNWVVYCSSVQINCSRLRGWVEKIIFR